MSKPLHPRVLQARQRRNKAAGGTLLSLLGIAAVILVFTLAIAATITYGNDGATAFTAIMGTPVALVAGGLALDRLVTQSAEMVREHQKARYILNEVLWDDHEREKKRLNTIMRQEGFL